MKRILITGAAGFIGYHLALRLADDREYQLVLADNFLRGKKDAEFQALLARPNIQMVEVDLTSVDSWKKLGQGFDEVYHLAAILGVQNVLTRPYDVIRVNTLTTLHLLDWLRQGGGRKILYSSTSEAYAWTQQFHSLPIPTPESVPLSLTDLGNPRSSYAGSKVFGELAITHGCASTNIPFVILRYHNVYGPRMGYEHVIPELTKRILSGEDPLRLASADHTRAFCYVSDAVNATVAAIRTEGAYGQTLHIGNDQEEISIGDLAQRILSLLPVKPKVTAIASQDPIKRRCPDISKARRLLHYQPQIKLDEGLKHTLDWYRQALKTNP
jgi:UDP-glucuronate decarboxylase